jgi:hypothetical protein
MNYFPSTPRLWMLDLKLSNLSLKCSSQAMLYIPGILICENTIVMMTFMYLRCWHVVMLLWNIEGHITLTSRTSHKLQNKTQFRTWRAYVKTVMSLRVLQKARHVVTCESLCHKERRPVSNRHAPLWNVNYVFSGHTMYLFVLISLNGYYFTFVRPKS